MIPCIILTISISYQTETKQKLNLTSRRSSFGKDKHTKYIFFTTFAERHMSSLVQLKLVRSSMELLLV